MTITITADDPRSIKALEIAAGAGQWLRCHARADGRKLYGIPSQCKDGLVYLADCQSCTCQDAARHEGQPCKHQLAVRLHVELVKAGQPKRRAPTGAPVAAPVVEVDDDDLPEFFARFVD